MRVESKWSNDRKPQTDEGTGRNMQDSGLACVNCQNPLGAIMAKKSTELFITAQKL